MNYVFYFGHPAHFHLFSNCISILKSKSHTVHIVIKPKDVLVDLLNEKGWDFFRITSKENNNKTSLLSDYPVRLINLYKFLRKKNIDLLVGTSWENAQVGKFMKISSITWNEDDAEVVPLFTKFCYPYTEVILSPKTCSVGKWNNKKISYSGYHELAYLFPKYFLPDRNIVDKYIKSDLPYFIIRLSKLLAHHDTGVRGIDDSLVYKMLTRFQNKRNIYITSEKELIPELERFRLNVIPVDIHNILNFADIYIGDSQTMAAEAAVLGTPSIRFNDFVGKLGYLEELEHKYGLTYGIKTSEPEKLFQKIDELLAMPNLKEEWQKRRQKMLSDNIDVTAFMVWFIENYPESVRIMKENPDYQYRFK